MPDGGDAVLALVTRVGALLQTARGRPHGVPLPQVRPSELNHSLQMFIEPRRVQVLSVDRSPPPLASKLRQIESETRRMTGSIFEHDVTR
jgi:hypothetical protein